MKKVIVVVGPTATGKSQLAVRLARKFGGEIISADSRQVYIGLNVGTGKITKKEMRGVPHHLLDIVSPKKRYTAADFKREASRAIEEILARGKVPIICGGTGFYIDALTRRISIPQVPPDENLRRALEKKSASNLLQTLRALDPRRADTIEPANKRRIIRAIEIAKKLGKVPKIKKSAAGHEFLHIGLDMDSKTLRQKIRERLEKRKKGMIKEARTLHEQGLSWRRMEELGLEYRYLARHLGGKTAEAEMMDKLETEIWRFARRQRAWFRRNKKIKWFRPEEVKEMEKYVCFVLRCTTGPAGVEPAVTVLETVGLPLTDGPFSRKSYHEI